MKIRYFCILIIGLISSTLISAQDYEVIKLPFNTLNSEIAPIINGNKIIYSSNKKTSILINYVDQDKNPLYHLYSVEQLKNDSWSHPIPFASEISSEFNDGPISISADGKTLIITKNQLDNYKKRRTSRKGNMLGLFISTLNDNNKWSNPEPFDFNEQRKHSYGQPSLSTDGKTLFFASDNSDGYGGTDIYYSENINGIWSEPKNLGSEINTDGNEVFPFFHPSGRLYFASNGHGGNGGLDIFYTEKKDKWSTPIALESPINSSKDDYAFVSVSTENEGYFTSNRNGSDDIFKFIQSFPVFNNCTAQEEDNFCFSLFENGPFDSDTLPYKYRWEFGDGTKAFGLEVDHCFPGPGLYNISLNVEDTLAHEDLFTVAQYELPLEKKEQIYITSPQSAKVNTEILFTTEKSHYASFQPDEFYWDFGDGIKKKGPSATHKYSKKGNYTISCGAVSIDDKTVKLCSTHQIIITD